MSGIIGERSLGHAVVNFYDESIPWLKKFLKDDNKWVNRSVGVAIHFFSKRVADQPEKTKILLHVVEPYLEEKQKDFVKGVGWGLKTIGKHHPDILVDFMKRQANRNLSSLLIRKAVTYLEEEKKAEVTQALQ
jgi:3-methyladenine DNA glycosylase AlkD